MAPYYYSILRKWIESGKICEGTKLITFGSEVQNLDKPCGPLEIPSVWDEIKRVLSDEECSKDLSESPEEDKAKSSSKNEDDFKCVFLKLHANSTRRARW